MRNLALSLGTLASVAVAVACSGSNGASTGSPSEAGAGTGGSGGSGGSDAGTAMGEAGTGGASTGGATGAAGSAVGGRDAGDAGRVPCTLAGAWTVADDYSHPGGNHTNPGQLTTSAKGKLYGTGISLGGGVVTGLVRSSADGKTFTLVKAGTGIGGDLAEAPDGSWFVTGTDGKGAARTVQKSVDGGKSWSLVDSVPLGAGACNTGYVAVNSQGKIYSAGSCDAEGWHVRVSENGGDTWSDVGVPFQLASAMPARLEDVKVDASDHVYVSGTAQDGSQVSHWLVRRLGDAGAFETVDDFQLEPGRSGISPTLAGKRRLYAVGSAESAAGKRFIVRRAGASGKDWTTLDDYSRADTTDLVATGLYESENGVLVSAGTATNTAGLASVVTRRSTDDGKTWAPLDEWTYVAGKPSSTAGHLVSDASGNVYGAVRGVAADDHAHWLIRKLACGEP